MAENLSHFVSYHLLSFLQIVVKLFLFLNDKQCCYEHSLHMTSYKHMQVFLSYVTKLWWLCHLLHLYSLLLEIVKLHSKVSHLSIPLPSIFRVLVSILFTSIWYCQTLLFGSLSIKVNFGILFIYFYIFYYLLWTFIVYNRICLLFETFLKIWKTLVSFFSDTFIFMYVVYLFTNFFFLWLFSHLQ